MKVLITGGAGSLGRRLIEELLKPRYQVECIKVLDNSENGLMRLKVRCNFDPRLTYILGDIRNKEQVKKAMRGIDVCIHCAAAKHLDIGEHNRLECISINVLGTQNCIDAALDQNIGKFIHISTDKAVEPICTYGHSKALAESLVLDANNDVETKFSIVRSPNFMGSDGSVFEVWNYQMQNNLPLTITDKRMTRYFMEFPKLIEFIIHCAELMEGGEIFVPTTYKEYKIIDLAKQYDSKIEFIGPVKGEKLKDILYTSEEKAKSHMNGDIMVILGR